MNRFFLLLCLLCCSVMAGGCAANKTVKLEWNTSGDSSRYYRTSIMEELPEIARVPVDAQKLIASPSLSEKEISQLNAIPIDVDKLPLLTSFSKKGANNFTVRMVRAEPKFDSPPKDENEAKKRGFLKQMAGTLQLDAEIDKSGTLKSFYLRRSQANVASIFFSLPKTEVAVGDSWSIPVVLTTLGTGFIADTVKRVSKVKLVNLYKTENYGQVAELIYVISEYLEGKVSLRPGKDENPPSFSIGSSFIGMGKFSVDNGMWVNFIGELKIKGEGNAHIDTTKLLTLVPFTKQ